MGLSKNRLALNPMDYHGLSRIEHHFPYENDYYYYHDHGHVHFVPQNTVFFDVRTCCRRRRGQTEGFARIITIITIIIFVP
jgi:hypothetical protein